MYLCPQNMYIDMMMNKLIGFALLMLCLTGCVRDNDAIYYPVGDIDVERGTPITEIGSGNVLVARSYNVEDFVLDSVAKYPNDPTLGKLTFMVNLKNGLEGQAATTFNGVGEPQLTMSLGYKDGNYPIESQIPIYASSSETMKYAVKLRLKGELTVPNNEWIIDYAYTELSASFQPYPPVDYPEVFMCKGGQKFGVFDATRRTYSFDVVYERGDLSFSQLYFNLFINLAGQKSESQVRLRIDKDSYFELYEQHNDL